MPRLEGLRRLHLAQRHRDAALLASEEIDIRPCRAVDFKSMASALRPSLFKDGFLRTFVFTNNVLIHIRRTSCRAFSTRCSRLEKNKSGASNILPQQGYVLHSAR
jgi:hypothetical protein